MFSSMWEFFCAKRQSFLNDFIQKRLLPQFPLSKEPYCVVKNEAFEVKFESWFCHFLAV